MLSSQAHYLDTMECFHHLCTLPQLATLRTDKSCDLTDAPALLRNAPPYGALRLRNLHVSGERTEDASSLVPLLASHALLKGFGMNTTALSPAGLETLLDTVLSLRLEALCLDDITAELSAHSLVRLLNGGTLKHLFLSFPLHDVASPAFIGALRGCTLVSFGIGGFSLGLEDCLTLLAALVRHPTILELGFYFNPPGGHRTALGNALAALLAADSLRELTFHKWDLGDAGMRPVLAALKGCTALRELDCWDINITAGFARRVLLPSVQANKSLRALTLLINGLGMQELMQAEMLVKARAAV